ncbi:helix-turn-helix domain-containing protein [Streptomyces sp. NPDC058299]|uniref:helix-turn-helix domain-containing protein n=1 Tax=Streptomyces sp. NPDC058299 TaxID=3346435 RepID=UPI0036EA97AD
MSVRIIECTNPVGLHRHYDGETGAQPAYIELDLREGTLHADYDSEIGSAVPFSVYHGFERRYGIPVLTAEAANRVLREIAPLAERILADWEEEWDGNNMVAHLGEDAQAAEEEIEDKLGSNLSAGDLGHFAPDDRVTEWDLDGAVNGSEVDDYGITADTTDARLEEIEQQILSDLAACGEGSVVVCHGLDDYLKELRDDLAEEDPLTPAEVRIAREYLGLTGDKMAERLGVNPRTLRSWEQGRDAIPGRIRPEIAELKAATDAAVAELVAGLEDGDDDTLITYRNDDEYKAGVSGTPWSEGWHGWAASWHRQVCARAAAQTGARIDFVDDETGE